MHLVSNFFVEYNIDINANITADPRNFLDKVLQLNPVLVDEFQFLETGLGTHLCFPTIL